MKPMRSSEPTTDRTLLGIGIVVLGWLAFACMDAGSKILASTYPIVQILWVRYLLFVLVAYGLMTRKTLPIRTSRPALHVLRGLLLVTEIAMVVYAFSKMQLADVHAILAITPLIVTALSVPLLGEQVGIRRWSAVGVAFIGMLIILRPGFGVLQPITFLVLLAALMFALYLVLTRMTSRTDPPEVSLFWIAITGFAGLSALVPFYWRMPETLSDVALFALVAALGVTAHFCLIKALQLAEASVLQPYNYTVLLGAIVVGYIVFDDLPDLPTTIGASIIVASGVYVFARERKLRSTSVR
jgi:drug/metabolite transporter (DMT)-like permease